MYIATSISADSWAEVNCNFNVICSLVDVEPWNTPKSIWKEIVCLCVCVLILEWSNYITVMKTPNITSPDEYFNDFSHRYVCLNKLKPGLDYHHRILTNQILGWQRCYVAWNKCTHDLPRYEHNTELIAEVKLICMNCS